MEKYIKIANRADNVNRLTLEKLGLSTKRNDPETIGQFGSGIKYAPIAALRMGLDFIFSGRDEKGEYTLKYSKVNEDGIDCIVYDYGTYTKPSSFTVDAGVLSWDNAFQIYREAISNAKDSGSWFKTVTDNIDSDPEYFSVFITASPEMMEIYNYHDKYFCDNRTILHEDRVSKVKMLQKYNSTLRIYCKTVMVYEDDMDGKHKHLFDYQFDSAALNEDRALKSVATTKFYIQSAIARLDNNELVNHIIKKLFNPEDYYWEFQDSVTSWDYDTINDTWRYEFEKIYGENCVLLSPEQSISPAIFSYMKSIGKKPVVCHSNSVYKFFSKAGVRTASDIVDEGVDYDINTEISKYPKLVSAIKIAKSFEPGLANLNKPICVFTSKEESTILGLTINMKKDVDERQILIEHDHAANANVSELIGTLIHEYDHLVTGVTDTMAREFRNLADVRIGNLMNSLYKETDISIYNGFIEIKLEDISKFQTLDYVIEYFEPFGCHLAQIGKLRFILDLDDRIDHKKGVVLPSADGTKLVIEIGCNGTAKGL